MLRYLRLYRTIIRTFGFRVRPIFTFLLKQIHRLISGGTRGLDHVVYPGFKKRKLDRPIFILGNPRSGTTFVHRFLLNSQRLCAFELWEMLLPAITARRMFGDAPFAEMAAFAASLPCATYSQGKRLAEASERLKRC